MSKDLLINNLSELPRLQDSKIISLHVETFDPDYKNSGAGWATKNGYIQGVSLATSDFCGYFPLRINGEKSANYDNILKYLKDVLKGENNKVGANLLYCLGWLSTENIEVNGELFDILNAEALLCEETSTDLKLFEKKYFNSAELSSCNSFVEYAEKMARLPLEIFKKQWGLLKEKDLTNLFKIENALIPILMKMRKKGVAVDVKKAELLYNEFTKKERELLEIIRSNTGVSVDLWASSSVAKIFDFYNIPKNLNKNGNISFSSDNLKKVNNEDVKRLLEARQLNKLSNVFIKNYILNAHKNGVLFGQFHPLKFDNVGTLSGRFSSSQPNLQNIPSKGEKGQLIRSLFIPFENGKAWRKYDYSQIEYRFLAHFAVGAGSEEVREKYNLNPLTDFHTATSELIEKITDIKLDRKITKNINFGLSYGMGANTLAETLNISMAEALKLFESYHKGAPFVKSTMLATMKEAEETGFIRTILGRRSSLNKQNSYKALNRKLQGSSADLLKLALVKIEESGLFNELGYPTITVHDELNFTDFGGKEEAFKELKYLLENSMSLKIPIIANCEIGKNWGEVKEI